MVFHSCSLHRTAAVFCQRPTALGYSHQRHLALQGRKPLVVGGASWKRGLYGCVKRHWRCRADSVTAESQPVAPKPSKAEGSTSEPLAPAEPKPISEAVVGKTYKGTIAGLAKFGAFVDLGFEKDALIHISELSDSYVATPEDVVQKGEKVTCIMSAVDTEQGTLRARLASLDPGIKSTTGLVRTSRPKQMGKEIPFQVGEEVEATVFKVHSWGAFANLLDGFSGLLHVSELDAVRNMKATGESPNAEDYLAEGDKLTLRVLAVEDKKISLTQMTGEEIEEATKLKKSGLTAGMEEGIPCLFSLMFSDYGILRDNFASMPEGASLSYDESDEVDLPDEDSAGETVIPTPEPIVAQKVISEEPELSEDPNLSVGTPDMPIEKEDSPVASAPAITAALVKELRNVSGAGMMDCKKALTEANGDMAEAEAILKKKGIATAAKKAGRIASEGAIGAYIHTGSRLGVIIEVNCETDFVARNPIFKELVEDMAMQVAASTEAICVSVDDFPQDVLEQEKAIELAKEDLQSKPEAIREKIVTGRLDKLRKTAALLEQAYIKDSNQTVKETITDAVATLGEKITIRRFERFTLGEGLEKRNTDFAAEVAEQTQKKTEVVGEKEAPKVQDTALEEPDVSNVVVSAKDVKALRQKSGAGMMDCKKALQKCNGDMEEAVVYLKVKGMAVADKKASRIASEGRVASYIHTGARLGVLAEINCETDFVSRGDIFKELVEDICMQIAASGSVQYVRQEDIPKDTLDKEREIEMSKEDLQNKPEQVREKMVEGRLQKYAKALSLMDQPYIKDNDKTVEDVIREAIGTIGENIQIRRFSKFNLGEGIEKRSDDFAAEVAAQTKGT